MRKQFAIAVASALLAVQLAGCAIDAQPGTPTSTPQEPSSAVVTQEEQKAAESSVAGDGEAPSQPSSSETGGGEKAQAGAVTQVDYVSVEPMDSQDYYLVISNSADGAQVHAIMPWASEIYGLYPNGVASGSTQMVDYTIPDDPKRGTMEVSVSGANAVLYLQYGESPEKLGPFEFVAE